MADLVSDPLFPDSPDWVTYEPYFELWASGNINIPPPVSSGYHDYGAQMIGWFYPPTNGNYTFYICSDDQSELFLSTDTDPANKRLIAAETAWSGPREYTNSSSSDPSDLTAKRSDQYSSTQWPTGHTITLTKGRAYYIEAIMKENDVGGDGLSVSIDGDLPISGQYLAHPPVVEVPNTNINELALWQYTPTFEGGGYTFGLSNAPAGMTLGTYSGTISWTPTQTQATHTYTNIAYLVYQAGSPIGSTSFSVSVNDLNATPTLHVPGTQIVHAGATLTVTNTATQNEIWATSLSFGIVSAPAGVAIDPDTGVVTWTPTTGQAGTNTITVSVTDYDPYAVDAQYLSVTNSFWVIVISLVPPIITQQPVSVSTNQGANVAFTVGAVGSPPLSYQWFFNRTNLLAGATNATLTLWNVQTNQAGLYAAVVSNMAGSATSSNAVLTVLVPPWITQQPIDVTTNQGANVIFSVAAAGSPPLGYQWWFNGTNLFASATNATLALLVVQLSQSGSYSVTVSNPVGFINSRAASLTVLGPLSASIVSPVDGAGFAVGSNISVAASASELNGAVKGLSVISQAEDNSIHLLASAASGTCSFVWTNAPIGTNRLTAVATDTLGSSVTSAAVRVVVTNPVPVLSVALTAPANDAVVCFGNGVQLRASVTNEQPVVSVEFYAGGTLVGSAVSAPYQCDWSSPQVGIYTLSARVTDAQGHSAVSSPISITVTPQCSPIAIVRAGPDPEIDALQSYLLEMGLGSQVFDQAGLSLDLLHGFQLVIWDDLGVLTNGLTPNTVDVLNGVYTSGTNLYLIGEHLVSAGAQLPSTNQQAEWISLTHLGAASGGNCNGTITITNSEGASNRVLWGPFGLIGDFGYPPRIEMATNDPSSELLAQCGGASALVIYPPMNSPGPTQVVVQDFRVLPPDAPASTNVLVELFKNSVCWLTGCQNCPDAHLAVQGTQTNDVVLVGRVMSYTLTAVASGECPPFGVRLTNSLPATFFFLGATNEEGSWTYDPVQRQVIFFIGLIANDGALDFGVTVAPMQVGTFTNDAVIRWSLSATQEMVRSMDSPLVTTVLPATNPPPRVTLRLLSPGGVELSLSGQANLVYGIDSSSDLMHWGLFTNVLGPTWTQDVLHLPGTGAPRQFYRAWTRH